MKGSNKMHYRTINFIRWLPLLALICCVKITFGQNVKNPVILLSFDGVRMDKLDNYLMITPNSNISKFIENGIKAEYMQSSFPSLTFPNHWSIITGVYPGYHGIVSNSIYDPIADLKVNLIRDSIAGQVRWWNRSDPIWLVASQNGLKTGAYFWAGSDIEGRNPDYWMPFNYTTPFEERVDNIIKWQLEKKLDFTCGYFQEPDSTGHTYGPDSLQYANAIARMDGVVGYLMKKIADNNLTHINIILVSDHGMVNITKGIYFGDYVNPAYVDMNRTDFYTISNIYPSAGANLSVVYDALSKMPNVDIYYKNQIPERFNYRASDRIAPILAVAREGIQLMPTNTTIPNTGGHGYDPMLLSMRSMFLAQGPAFKKKVVLSAFENVNVKPLICGLLKINCPNTNGTIYKFQSGLVDQSFFNSAPPKSFNLLSIVSLILLSKLLMP